MHVRKASDRILEPDRLTAIDSEGVPYGIYSGGEKLAEEDFPLGSHFYHYSKVENLDLIARNGLKASEEKEWRMEEYDEAVNKGESRLYLLAQEYDCLSELYFSPKKLAGLRFRRQIVKEMEKVFDGRYGGSLFSFYVVNATIPAAELQVCRNPQWVQGSTRLKGNWMPLIRRHL